MNHIARCLLLLGTLLLAACGGAEPRLADGPLPFETLETVTNSGIQKAENFVVRDNESFQKLWTRAYSLYTNPPPEMPKVDFSRKMVLAVAPGYLSACSGFAIKDVAASGGTVVVNFVVSPPPPNVMCIAAVFAQVSMIVVERAEADVKFIGS